MISLRSNEIAIELFRVVDPSSTQDFESIGFVGIILTQVANIALLFILVPQVALEGILMLVDAILQWLGQEWLFAMERLLLFFMIKTILRCLFKVELIWRLMIVEFLEIATPALQFNVVTLFDLTVQIRFNLAAAPLRNVTGHQMPWQVS